MKHLLLLSFAFLFFTSCKKSGSSSSITTGDYSTYPISQCKISKITRPGALGYTYVYTFTYDSLDRIVHISESELNYTFSFVYYGNYVVRTVSDTSAFEVDSIHLNSFGLIDTEISSFRATSKIKYTMYYDASGKIQKMNTTNIIGSQDIDYHWDIANLRGATINAADTFSYTNMAIQPGDYLLWNDFITYGGIRVKNTNLVSVMYPVDGQGGSSTGYCRYHFDKGGKITSTAVSINYNGSGTIIAAWDSLNYDYICH